MVSRLPRPDLRPARHRHRQAARRACRSAIASVLLYGSGDRTYRVKVKSGRSRKGYFRPWEGIMPRLERRFKQASSERAKRWYAAVPRQRHSCSTL